MQASLTASSVSSLAANAMGLHAVAQDRAHAFSGGVDSHALLQGQKAVSIIHNGTTYRLQATKLGKLILTK